MMNYRICKLALCLSSVWLSACTPQSQNTTTSTNMNPLEEMGDIKSVASGFISTEGPVWHEKSGQMIFTDIPGNTVYGLNVGSGELSIIRKPSNTSNGLALDAEGYLLAAEQASRSITRMNLETGDVTPFIDSVMIDGEMKALNSPNDMAIHKNGNVYFTDPPFGLRGREEEREIAFNGVFVRQAHGETILLKSFKIGNNPNGIILSPDQKTLYFNISHNESGPVLAYDVDANGNLLNGHEIARGQNMDGMAIDSLGNIYIATKTSVKVWSAEGKYWGEIVLPNNIRPTNVAFGGDQKNTLYITNRSADLYAVKLNVVGYQ